MTIIAWDRKTKTLAADRQSTWSGLRLKTTKIFKHDNELLAISGDDDQGRVLVQWYKNGANKDNFPEFKTPNALLYVFDGSIYIKMYHENFLPNICEEEIFSCGSGRDFAYTALYLGKTPKESVEIACLFESSCGMGIDELTLE